MTAAQLVDARAERDRGSTKRRRGQRSPGATSAGSSRVPADRDSILRAVARAEHSEAPHELSTLSPQTGRSLLLVVPGDLHRRLQAEASRAGVPLVSLAVRALELAVES